MFRHFSVLDTSQGRHKMSAAPQDEVVSICSLHQLTAILLTSVNSTEWTQLVQETHKFRPFTI